MELFRPVLVSVLVCVNVFEHRSRFAGTEVVFAIYCDISTEAGRVLRILQEGTEELFAGYGNQQSPFAGLNVALEKIELLPRPHYQPSSTDRCRKRSPQSSGL